MRERSLRIARWGAGVVVLAFVARAIVRNWQELATHPIAWTFRPLPALASVLLVWLMYGVLIEAWRRMLGGWGQRLDRREAIRIWLLSSLGKYVPGKVWAIAGMAVMAREAGVGPGAAMASAVIMQVLALGSGAMVAAGFGAGALETTRPGLLPWFWVGGLLALGAIAVLVAPGGVRRLLAVTKLGEAGTATPGVTPLTFGLVANFVAWIGYGLALWLLGLAVLPEPALGAPLAIAAFAASYVVGYLALVAPAGLVVREGLLIVLLQGSLGLGAATALALASRVLLTITEVGAALPFAVRRRRIPRVA
ncbi:MAG TPA: hypothetical protein VNK43_09735 [Gemmatimonadales bacterium]|nr:hypothetical protein [Gemmatimonadales bacterium]